MLSVSAIISDAQLESRRPGRPLKVAHIIIPFASDLQLTAVSKMKPTTHHVDSIEIKMFYFSLPVHTKNFDHVTVNRALIQQNRSALHTQILAVMTG